MEQNEQHLSPDLDVADPGAYSGPLVIPHSEHGISRRDIDPLALKVLYRLAKNDFTAYLVGGGVRDLILKRKPKDFDISTNARPEQIKELFKNCLLIGRRFRLAHIRYGDKIIETSTFRRAPECSADPNDPEADLFQRDDNMFGSPEEDARRRDFTVNGLFYDIESFSVIDYVGGIEDLQKRVIRSIGDPGIRFREDPVRMIRAIRFASRMDFTIDPNDLDAMSKHREEIAKASPARMLEEICRLFAFSSGQKAVRLLGTTGLLDIVLPEVAAYLKETADASPFWRRLAALDEGDTVLAEPTQALIFAVLFTDPINHGLETGVGAGHSRNFKRVRSFIREAALRLNLPRKLKDKLTRIIGGQWRFHSLGKRRAAENLVRQDIFPESLALAEINATVLNSPPATLNPWREMYADTVCSKEESRSRSQSAKKANKNPQAAEEPAILETVSGDSGKSSPSPGQGLSRSARRRRNRQKNRAKRQQEGVNAAVQENSIAVPVQSAQPAEPVVNTIVEPVAVIEPVAAVEPVAETKPEPVKAPAKKRSAGKTADKQQTQPKEAKKSRTAVRKKTEPAAEQTESEEMAAVGPLTAASFYAKPVAEKKPAKKASSRTKSRKSENTAPMVQPGTPVASPFGVGRAEEANMPMHWLDEI